MKVFEVLKNNVGAPSSEELERALRGANWSYEYDPNPMAFAKGHSYMQLLENMVYQFWKVNPDKANELWKKHCPQAVDGTPSFILRLQAQELAPCRTSS